jgi:hypothetical protein
MSLLFIRLVVNIFEEISFEDLFFELQVIFIMIIFFQIIVDTIVEGLGVGRIAKSMIGKLSQFLFLQLLLTVILHNRLQVLMIGCAVILKEVFSD